MHPLLKALPTDRLPHVWQVLATLLAVASLFTLCWYLSQYGLLDLAATAVSFFTITFLRQLAPSLASRAPSELRQTASLLDTARTELAAYLRNRKTFTLALFSIVATVCFLIGRALASIVLVAIASPWLALSGGLLLGAVVASPVLAKSVIASFHSSRRAGDSDV